MKILIIGSSASLPRPNGTYEDTWPALLKNHFPTDDIILLAKRRNNTYSLQRSTDPQWAYGDSLHFYDPDIVITQIGISDCFPRYLRASSLVNKLIERSPAGVQTLFWKIYKLFIKRSIKRADVPYKDFCINIDRYLNECKKGHVKKVIIIHIYTPPKWLRNRIPMLMEAIDMYNNAYKTIAKKYSFAEVVEPLSSGNDEDFLPDGMHLTPCGHLKVLDSIKTYIKPA